MIFIANNYRVIRLVVPNLELNGISTCNCYLATATVNNVDTKHYKLTTPTRGLFKQNERWREGGRKGRKKEGKWSVWERGRKSSRMWERGRKEER